MDVIVVDKANMAFQQRTLDYNVDIYMSTLDQQLLHNFGVPMVEKFIIRRFYDKHFIDYFAGINSKGDISWCDDEMYARTYRTLQSALDAINNLLLRDTSSYPNGREGYINQESQYQFDALPVQRKHNPNEVEYRRHNYIPERESSLPAAHATHAVIEHKEFSAAAILGHEAAHLDYLNKSDKATANPFPPTTAQHVAWHEGYEEYENKVWSGM